MVWYDKMKMRCILWYGMVKFNVLISNLHWLGFDYGWLNVNVQRNTCASLGHGLSRNNGLALVIIGKIIGSFEN